MAGDGSLNKIRTGFPINSLRICVDACGASNINGRICGVGLRDTLYFQDYSGLILEIDQALDMIGAPQQYQQKRSFNLYNQEQPSKHIPQRYKEEYEIHGECGTQKTLDVIITSRQHTSMQGCIYNMDGERIDCFHSDVELMKLVLDC